MTPRSVTPLSLGLVAWGAGFLAYVGALMVLYHQSLSAGDFGWVVVSSLLAFGLCYFGIYLPVLRLVRRVMRGTRPAWLFPLISVLLGVLPTAVIVRFYSGSFRALRSPEALLFLILFMVVGLVVGLGFRYLDRDEATPR